MFFWGGGLGDHFQLATLSKFLYFRSTFHSLHLFLSLLMEDWNAVSTPYFSLVLMVWLWMSVGYWPSISSQSIPYPDLFLSYFL